MSKTTIEVTITEAGKVRFQPRDWARLHRGDTVVWEFQGVPEGSEPCLLFTELPESHSARLPFERLSCDGNTIVGHGYDGADRGVYRYQFGMLPQAGGGAAAIRLPYDRTYEAGGLSSRGGPT